MAGTVNATEATFAQEVEQSPVLTLVDFWAPWCGPCKMIAPVLEQIAAEKGDAIKIVKVDSDENPRLSARYGVRGIPMLLFFKGGQPVGQIVGAVPKAKIEAAIAQFS
jgi:thioredoxin 1